MKKDNRIPDDAGPLDEFEWEKMLRESDKVTDRYSSLLDKYMDHPDRDRIIAREMNWSWLEQTLAEEAQEEEPGEEEEDEEDAREDFEPLEPNPLTEGVDWIRTERGRITHPLSEKAFQCGMNMWHYCEDLGFIGDDGDDEVLEMLMQAQTLGAKLCGALDSLAYDTDVEGGFVVASLKRALKFFSLCLGAVDRVRQKEIIDPQRLEQFRSELFAVREEIIRLMRRYRAQD